MFQKIKLFFAGAMLLCLCSFPAFAADEYQVEVTNGISLGDISISLKNYTKDENGNEIPFKSVKSVLPGEEVDKIVRITNEAEPAWIRVKVEYNGDEGLTHLDDSMVHVSDPNWKKVGTYYYYTKGVGNETIELMDRLTIPHEWDRSQEREHFQVIVTAEAVQCSNFTPDFESDDPWFGTLVETCVHSDYSSVAKNNQTFSVNFENGAEGFVKIGDDFFSNFGTLMPGDVVTDSVTVGNRYNEDVEIFFSTTSEGTEEMEKELLEKVMLSISEDGTELYKGSLSADALKDGISLGIFKNGDTKTISYTVSVPVEFTNRYALSNAKVTWIFRTELKEPEPVVPVEPDKPATTGPRGSFSGTSVQTVEPPVETARQAVTVIEPVIEKAKDLVENVVNIVIPKTGDTTNLMISIIGLFLSVTCIALIIYEKRWKRER